MDLYNLVVSAKLIKGEGGGGGDIDVDPLTVTENGTYTASSGHAYSPVTVSVPQSGITPTGTSNITSNGIYDIASFASASVNVPGIVPSGTSSITSNGIYDITNFASVDVNVSGGGGGDHDAEDGMIMKTLSGMYENSRVTLIGSSAFRAISTLTGVSFPNVSRISAYAFYSCSNLTEMYFLSTATTTLDSTAALSGTPMANSSYTGSYGSIYVPASLVSDYKAKDNWSAYKDRITSYVE